MKPSCYNCAYRADVIGSCHSQCVNGIAYLLGEGVEPKPIVTGTPHGIENGWFFWPLNYDPIWLESCTGFVAKAKE